MSCQESHLPTVLELEVCPKCNRKLQHNRHLEGKQDRQTFFCICVLCTVNIIGHRFARITSYEQPNSKTLKARKNWLDGTNS
jgi:hypothetical protein